MIQAPSNRLASLLVAASLAVGGLAGVTASVLTSSASSAFPTATNRGVPASEVLTAYTGPMTITQCGTVIDHKIITGQLNVRASNGNAASYSTESAAKSAACVTLTDVRINVPGGTSLGLSTSYTSSTACNPKPCGPVYAADTDIITTGTPTGIINPVNETNLNLYRMNITGGDQAVNCDGYCAIHDSWLEASRLDTTGNAHMDAFSGNGNSGHPIVLDHNTLYCHVTNQASVPAGSGGCSGDVGFFNDFGQNANVTVTNNLFIASQDPSYCAYTGAFQANKAYPTGANLNWSNNVWQRGTNAKCGQYGPVADWQSGNGNVWCNNNWDDGTFVIPAAENCSTAATTTSTLLPTTTVPVTLPPPPSTTTTRPSTTTTSTVPPATSTTTSTTLPPPTTTTTLPPDCLKAVTADGKRICVIS